MEAKLPLTDASASVLLNNRLLLVLLENVTTLLSAAGTDRPDSTDGEACWNAKAETTAGTVTARSIIAVAASRPNVVTGSALRGDNLVFDIFL